jgi:hypothetical protein
MDEVDGPVDWIDDPPVPRALASARYVPGFLAQDRVAGKRRAKRRDDRVLGLDVCRRHDVAMILGERGRRTKSRAASVITAAALRAACIATDRTESSPALMRCFRRIELRSSCRPF